MQSPADAPTLFRASGTLSVLHDLEKRPIISENVNVSTQERTVRYKLTGSHLSFVLDLVSEFFLGKSSGCNFPPWPATWITSSRPPPPPVSSFTFTAEHTVPYITAVSCARGSLCPDCNCQEQGHVALLFMTWHQELSQKVLHHSNNIQANNFLFPETLLVEITDTYLFSCSFIHQEFPVP